MIKPLLMAGVVFLSGMAVLPARADVNSDLNGFFGSLGYSGNASKAQAWQGQAAGYFTGGSVYLRNPVKNIQLISMQLPSLNAGCGGIDAYLGSFSMISGEEIQRFVKQIMSNAAGYAFDLALQTMVPELKQAKDFLQKLANDVNSMNMSSCQAAQGIIGGLWPVTQVSQQKICQDIAGESNMFSDWAASRQGCTVGGQSDSVTSRAGDDEKDQVLKDKNLIWDALARNHMFDSNRQLKELVMSTVGSIIFNKDGDVTILTPLVDNRDLVKVLMRGGSAKVYGCDEDNRRRRFASGTGESGGQPGCRVAGCCFTRATGAGINACAPAIRRTGACTAPGGDGGREDGRVAVK